MINLARVAISSIIEGLIKRFTGTGRPNEAFTAREYFQHYGFTSRPLEGAQGVALIKDGQVFMIASDDSRYRISLENGEVALYTDEGDCIHFKRDNIIHVESKGTVEVEAPAVTVDCETLTATASQSATIQADIVMTGDLDITGDLTLTGNLDITGDLDITGTVSITGGLDVTGNITATGTILDTTGNSNHHSHI